MKHLLTAIALSVVPLFAQAAPPTDESIKALFKVMKAEAVIEGVYASMVPMMRRTAEQGAGGAALSDAQKAAMERGLNRMADLLRTEMSWTRMEPLQIAIYRESFDQAEVDGLIAFYQSPVGQSYVSKMPVVTQRAMQEVQAQMQQLLPKVQALALELNAEMKAASGK